MVFSSMLFLFIFLPALFLLYFAVPKGLRWLRNFVLLAFSLVFYASNEPKNVLIMVASAFINYLLGLLVERAKARRLVLTLCVLLNLGLLVYYKYTNFILDSLGAVTGISCGIKKIIMPVGISFFTFQAMSYVFDIYYGTTRAQKNPLNVVLYIALFPQLVAGPIVRYETVAEEILHRNETTEEVAAGIFTFIIGFAKKLLIANTVGIVADNAFAEGNLSTGLAWLGIVAYTLQIYFDFSAYSDMAVGLGRVFGFHFPQNFNYPYISQSVTEFWRRWHISLSVWFRDYLYIPLGGNRCSKAKHLRNIMVVWLATGIWHGAGWNSVVWGLYYGLILILEKQLLGAFLNRLPRLLRHIYTLLIVLVGFVFFRADNMGAALRYLGAMFTPTYGLNSCLQLLRDNAFVLACGLIGSLPVAGLFKGLPARGLFRLVYSIPLFLLALVYLTSSTFNPFIYFRF